MWTIYLGSKCFNPDEQFRLSCTTPIFSIWREFSCARFFPRIIWVCLVTSIIMIHGYDLGASINNVEIWRGRSWGLAKWSFYYVSHEYDHVVYECPLSCLLMIILLISRFENFGPQMTFFGFTFMVNSWWKISGNPIWPISLYLWHFSLVYIFIWKCLLHTIQH